MQVSLNWLNEFVDISDIEPSQIAHELTMSGLEVEGIEEVKPKFTNIKTVKIEKIDAHPNSDRLHLVTVNTGSGLKTVVCGAQNIKEGQIVPYASVGSKVLDRKTGEQFELTPAVIRGVESQGMLCSDDELGVSGRNYQQEDGILILNNIFPDVKIGEDVKDVLGFEKDTVLDVAPTANRGDQMSILGVARELCALFNKPLKFNPIECTKDLTTDKFKVEISDKDVCKYYSLGLLKNIKIKPSPDWMQKRLEASGMRAINNVVDITNYVMLEYGCPMHAFDADKLDGYLCVRRAKEGEKLTTLDGVERKLSGQDLMICNAESPMCIAGVFGGLDSGVKMADGEKPGTTSVFLESAYFNPVLIRKTSKRHTLKTEASFRYERGCDPNMVPYALKRAAMLVLELAGGEIVGPVKDVVSKPIEKKVVELDYARMESLMGCKIGNEKIHQILEYLEMEFVSESETGCVVKVPTYRVDVYRECDVVEDVLRIYGYNNVPLPGSMKCSVNIAPHPDPEKIRKTACETLTANGFMEMMNNSLTKSAYYEDLKTYPQDKLVMICNPLSSDLNCMRQTLILNGLEVVAYNINRQETQLKLYEFGNVYSFNKDYVKPEEERSTLKAYTERPKLSLFVTGEGLKSWRSQTVSGDYFSLKGYVELLLKKFAIELKDLDYEGAAPDIFSEGLTYKLKASGKEIVTMGAIKDKLAKKFGIKQKVYAAEFSWDVLLNKIKKNTVKFTELPRFPEVKRDLALLLDYQVSFADLRNAAYQAEKKLLKNIVLFDVYTGDKIPEGKKQYAISFYLQDPDKTLTDKAVDAIMEKLLRVFKEKFGAELR